MKFLLLSLGRLRWAFPGTAQTAPSKWLSYDAATKTVTFPLNPAAKSPNWATSQSRRIYPIGEARLS